MGTTKLQLGYTVLSALASLMVLGCGNDELDAQTPPASGEQRVRLTRQDVLSMGFSDNQNGVIAGGELLLNDIDQAGPNLIYSTVSLKNDGTTSVCSGYYVDRPSVRYADQVYLSDRILASSEGWGPRRLSVTVSRSVTSEASANVGISLSAVSAGVGFTIGSSFGVAASSEIDVPSGRYQRLEGYAKYDRYTFQIWYDGCPVPGPNTHVGDGQAFRPTGGVIFVTRTIR